METYLTIDIGNTAVSLAVAKGARVRASHSIPVGQPAKDFAREVQKTLAKMNRAHGAMHVGVICSVVPAKTAAVARLIRQHLSCPIRIIGKDLKVPLINKYKDPDQVGRDRLVGAYATQQLYGQPAIVVDFGTAITFDVLSAKSEYLGGVIVPGMRLSLESLHAKTAMLPQVEEVKRPAKVVGRTTEHSILSGLIYGYGEMCRGLIGRIGADLPGRPKVVVTGGYARMMVRFLEKYRPVVDQHLVHKGLVLCEKASRPL